MKKSQNQDNSVIQSVWADDERPLSQRDIILLFSCNVPCAFMLFLLGWVVFWSLGITVEYSWVIIPKYIGVGVVASMALCVSAYVTLIFAKSLVNLCRGHFREMNVGLNSSDHGDEPRPVQYKKIRVV